MARSVSGNLIRDFNFICKVKGRDDDFVRIGKPGSTNTRVALADLVNRRIVGESFLVETDAVQNLRKFADIASASEGERAKVQRATRTIRIDDEVWAWIKQHAEPLEDTPNSVLRRIAGLENEGQDASSEPFFSGE